MSDLLNGKALNIHLHNMQLGQRINDDTAKIYGWEWAITRVPGGWIYTAPQIDNSVSSHSVFVPLSNK